MSITMPTTIMNEKEYREMADHFFKNVSKAFDAIDPDLAECEYSQGALTILFQDRSKLILSMQPSVRQIWAAAAAKGIAHHFNFDEIKKIWLDDKGKNVELKSFIQQMVLESGKVHLKL
jgi:CyaY protein